jgi:hypothetical protein
MWIPYGFHVDSMWNLCGRSPYGMSMESMWNPCGIHVNKYLIYVIKHIPCGFHVDSMEYIHSTWIPHGMWGHGKVLHCIVVVVVVMQVVGTVCTKGALVVDGGRKRRSNENELQ